MSAAQPTAGTPGDGAGATSSGVSSTTPGTVTTPAVTPGTATSKTGTTRIAKRLPSAEPAPTPDSIGAWLVDLVFRDLNQKLLALIFAALVWIYINREITTQTDIVLPVRVVNASQHVLVTDVAPRQLRLTLRGPKEALGALKASDLATAMTLSAEARHLRDGDQSGTLVRRADGFYRLPAGVSVEGQLPLVRIEVVRAAERTLRLSPTFVGEPAPGYKIGAVLLEPSEVRLRGPATEIAKLQTLPTRPIQVGGRTAADSPLTTFVELPGQVGNKPVEVLEVRRVRVQLAIVPIVTAAELRLPNRQVYLSAPSDFEYQVKDINPARVEVVLSGPKEGIEQARASVRVVVELDSYDPATLAEHHKNLHYTLQVRGLPPGYRLLRLEVEDGGSRRAVEKVRVSMSKPSGD